MERRRTLRLALGPAVIALLAAALAIAAAALATAAPSATGAAARSAVHHHRLALTAPAQLDFALAEVRFHIPAHHPRWHGAADRGLRVTLGGPTGLDYVAAAEPRSQARGSLSVLVLTVNRRPRGSLAPDLSAVRVDAALARALGTPAVEQVVNVFSSPPTTTPAPCDLNAAHGLSEAGMRGLLGADGTINGLSARNAVAQAWNTACGAVVDPRFRPGVTGSATIKQPPRCPPCGPGPPASPRAIVCPQAGATVCPAARR